MASDAFISYSRRDAPFVRRLQAALAEHDKRVWVDWAEIPPTADWLAEIYAAIEDADAFIFVLSPDAISSEVCALELAHAGASGKRVIPLLARAVDARAVPAAAARHQWISFAGDAPFDDAFDAVLRALELDLEWRAAHTHWLGKSRDWEHSGRARRRLLRGGDIRDAEHWLLQSAAKQPPATPLQTEFIQASRHAATRRAQGAVAGTLAVLGVSIALTIVALVQRHTAQVQRRAAQAQALAARAQLATRADPAVALLYAREAARLSPIPQAVNALRATVGAADDLRRVLWTRGAAVTAVAPLARDGSTVVIGKADGSVRISDLTGERSTALPRAETGAVRALAVSPDGASVAVGGSSGLLVVVRRADGRRMLAWAAKPVIGGLTGPPAIQHVMFSPDGRRLLVATEDGSARVLALPSGRVAVTLRHLAPGQPAAFSPDGRRVVAAIGAGDLRLFSAATGHTLRTVRLAPGVVTGLAFDPSGRRIADCSGRRIFSVGGALLLRLDPRRFRVPKLVSLTESCAFTPDGRAVVDDDTILDARTGAQLHVLHGLFGHVTSFALTPDGRAVVTGGDDRTVRLWSLAGAHPREIRAPGLVDMDYDARTGQVLVAGDDGVARVFAARTGRLLHRLRGAGRLSAAAFGAGPVGFVTGTFDGRDVEVWTPGGTPLRSLSVPAVGASGLHDIAVDRAGRRVVTAGGDGALRVFSVASGRLEATLGGRPGAFFGPAATAVRFSPDGNRLVAGYQDGATRVWSLARHTASAVLRASDAAVSSIALDSAGRRVVVGDHDGAARVWSLATGHVEEVLSVPNAQLAGAALSPDGRLVAAADGRAGHVWAIPGGTGVLSWSSPSPILRIAFSADGRSVITGDYDGHVRFWPCTPCRPLAELSALARERAGRDLTPAERASVLG